MIKEKCYQKLGNFQINDFSKEFGKGENEFAKVADLNKAKCYAHKQLVGETMITLN